VNKPKVSIASLVYASPEWADSVASSLARTVAGLSDGDVEFFFVANNPTKEVVKHLKERGYPFFVHEKETPSDEELFASGFAWPGYLHGVYRAYNMAIREARGEIVVLVNSDHVFAPGWLKYLLAELTPNRIVSCACVEPWGVFRDSEFGTPALLADFGRTLETFDERSFFEFADQFIASNHGVTMGGEKMPCAFYKSVALDVGLYPEGNLAGATFNEIADFGDRRFFRKLRAKKVFHYTVWSSLVYHFKEGELRKKE
jgi:cellulose synthase/poly-beta-1,6-N-acetylglucosamine synthase-like glycosyltransferase